jgi:hypothetical protein
MKKIKALHAFILGLDLFAAEQMDSYVDDLRIVPAVRPAGTPEKIIITEMRYTATFFIERYPHGQVSPNILFAQISAWLIENDAERTEPIDFPMIVDLLDTETANLEFGIAFEELVIATEDANGSINVRNKKYALL